MLSKSGRVCFALEEQGSQRVCFGSSNLFTHIPKKNSWEAGGRPRARRLRMLWCYLRSPPLLCFPSAVLRHSQECREGQ